MRRRAEREGEPQAGRARANDALCAQPPDIRPL
jgi:hypothetical protein